MFYLIGLGLNEKSITEEGKEAVKKCKIIYIDSYTVELPYKIKDLEKVLGKKIVELKREQVESNFLIKEAKSKNVALLVYGGPLFATTHISLILDAKKQKVKTKIIYNASVFDAIAETGLQLYKFGKIASIPDASKGEANFLKYIYENQKINSHSLILIDIGLSYKEALEKLGKAVKEKEIKIDKIVVCSQLGTEKSKIYYDYIEKLKNKKIKQPFCFIIPSELHFLEKEALERFG